MTDVAGAGRREDAAAARRRPAKRAFDLVGSVLGLAALSPLLAVVALAVRVGGGPGPIFFGQHRVGHRGRPFRMWKFRTMVADAERHGPALTAAGDPRVTRVGALLRRCKLDELPQLLNVARGEMSLVGPRPEVPRYVALYTPGQRAVLELVPGITDPASIAYRHESELLAASSDPERTYVEELIPAKLRLNLQYASSATLWSDVRVILRTMGATVR